MALIRRRTAPVVAPAPAVDAPAAPAPRKGPKRRVSAEKSAEAANRIIEIRAANAFTAPESEGGSGTDYEGVVARYVSRIKNPMTAIRARCIQCSNGQVREVNFCQAESCALHPFRMGTNPFNKRVAERLAKGSGDDEDAGEE